MTQQDVSPLAEQVEQELDALADAVLENADDADFRSILSLATKELLRRFEEEPQNLPGTFVIKLVLDGLKAVAAKDVPVAQEADERSILDNLAALPKPHARKLLQREIDRVNGELARYHEAMEGLA